MFRKHILSFLAPAILLVVAAQASASIVSDFDAGLEGWTGVGGDVSWVSSGGNPDGYLRIDDNVAGDMFVQAPGKYLGDLSAAYNVGVLSFDALNDGNGFEPNLPALTFGKVTIEGAGKFVSANLASAADPMNNGQWYTFDAALTDSEWGTDLLEVLGDVTAIKVVLEYHTPVVESTGFDNFMIDGPVNAIPEPTTLAVWSLLGLVGLAVSVRRRK